jgi:hypothetical protein
MFAYPRGEDSVGRHSTELGGSPNKPTWWSAIGACGEFIEGRCNLQEQRPFWPAGKLRSEPAAVACFLCKLLALHSALPSSGLVLHSPGAGVEQDRFRQAAIYP